MSEEIEYPSKERERAKVNVKVSAEVNTYLHDLYNQIQYEFCEQYEDEIKDLQHKVEQLESIRKEAIEYIGKDITARALEQLCTNYQLEVSLLFVKIAKDLLNILNKGSDNNETF